MPSSTAPVLTALAVAALLAAIGAWVLRDAREHEAGGHPVVARVGGLSIERPEVWAGLCLLVVVLGLPLYLVARGSSAP